MTVPHIERRRFLALGSGGLLAISLMAVSRRAAAATNAAMRTALKYQSKPEGEKNCANCTQFVPGPDPKGPGGCKALAGDTEISPQGYCIAWAKKP